MTSLAARDVSKSFSGVNVLRDVSLEVRGGQIAAVVGENGAGKSTLMNILAGVLESDSGEILLNGSPTRFGNVSEARKAGVNIIFQEMHLVLQCFADFDQLSLTDAEIANQSFWTALQTE